MQNTAPGLIQKLRLYWLAIKHVMYLVKQNRNPERGIRKIETKNEGGTGQSIHRDPIRKQKTGGIGVGKTKTECKVTGNKEENQLPKKYEANPRNEQETNTHTNSRRYVESITLCKVKFKVLFTLGCTSSFNKYDHCYCVRSACCLSKMWAYVFCPSMKLKHPLPLRKSMH